MLELLPRGSGLKEGWQYCLVKGVVWRPLDDSLHAVYCPLSGETLLLNGTAVWVLELLAGPGWHHPDGVVRQVAIEAELPEEEVRASLGNIWTTLLGGGLLRRQRAAA
ncbi:MAG: hypothetical protein ACK5Y8_02935 [Betaproteobacteria bacterium]|nr:hypothetical protein [Burkholderiaceae bacterium]MCZ8110145.1 hypothetical protein [Rubrivivax sp.]MCZ8174320.1 hypothetical protein [Burkholderiaceae bacterium]